MLRSPWGQGRGLRQARARRSGCLADIIHRQSDVALSNSAQFQIGEILFNRANFEDPDKRAQVAGHAIDAYRAVQPKDAVMQAEQARAGA